MRDFVKLIVSKAINGKVLLLIAAFIIGCIYFAYTTPQDIHVSYNAVAYQKIEKDEISESIKVQIDGQYTRSLLGNSDLFVGTIIIGDDIVAAPSLPINFNKNKYAFLHTFSDDKIVLNGVVFINNMFETMTIQTHSYKNSNEIWWIAAPCNTISEAKEVSRLFAQRANLGITIENDFKK